MKSARIFFLLFAFLITSNVSFAQFNLLKKAKEKIQERTERKIDEGMDKGLDKVEEEAVKGSEEEAVKESEEEEQSNTIAENKEDNTSNSRSEKKESFKSYSKYDFVPGDQIILFEDFSQDNVGDFPALWTTNGTGEIRTTNLYPGNFLYMNATDKVYNLMKDIDLPQNFIFEFDVIAASAYEDGGGSNSFYLTLYKDDDEYLNDALYPGSAGVHLTLNNNSWTTRAYSSEIQTKSGDNYRSEGGSELSPIDPGILNHIIVWVQNRRFRVYHKGTKVLDLPTLLPTGVKLNRLRFSLWDQEGHPYISNIKFTTASPDTRSKLLTEGKFISYGILFDVNSDKIKPESYGALNDIAKVLKENPEVKIKIIGHTDSDGTDDSNLELSKKRSLSVKNSLATEFEIEETRMETDGKGESEPLSENTTALGKSQNRRVEFIKL